MNHRSAVDLLKKHGWQRLFTVGDLQHWTRGAERLILRVSFEGQAELWRQVQTPKSEDFEREVS